MPSPRMRAPLAVLALGLLLAAGALRAPVATQLVSAQSYPDLTAYPQPSASPTATPAPAATARPRATPPTLTPTLLPLVPPTSQPTAPPPSPTPAPPASATPPPLATSTPEPLLCAPGRTLALSGRAPANASLLAYFGRRVVGGGTAEADGRFTIVLRFGPERPAVYSLIVRVRGTWEEVLRTSCTVPPIAPTATPAR